jgi:hypothetical protein
MPSHEPPFLFLLATGPAMFLSVILHEFGHVLAARCAGIDVTAWGVGYRRPWFSCKVGSSVFYLGRPLSGGMTFTLHRKLDREPVKEFIMVLGGPMANLLGLAIGLVVIGLGERSAWIYAWSYVSAIYVLISAVPFTLTSKSFLFVNDAARLLHILRHGRELMTAPVGPALSSAQSMAELMQAIKCEAGLRISYASMAILQSALGDNSSARESLTAAMDGNCRGPLTFVAQSAIAVAENSDDAELAFAATRDQCKGDATSEFLVDCWQEQWRLKRDRGDADHRERLRQKAISASRRDWLCWIDCLVFEAEEVEDVESCCRSLLHDYRDHLDGITRARLLAVTSERLATQGDIDRAIALFQEAQTVISMEAATIASDVTRNAYLQSAAEPLRRVATLANIDSPRFDQPPIQDKSFRRRVFAYTALLLSIPAFAAGATLSILVRTDVLAVDSGLAIALVLPAVLGGMTALFAGMVSILRSEKNRWRILSTALPLAFLALMAVGFGLSSE